MHWCPQEHTIESCLALLGRSNLDVVRRSELLCCMGALLAHRRVAELLADVDPALQRVLSTPVTLHTAGKIQQLGSTSVILLTDI